MAVDSGHQQHGVASALVEVAVDHCRQQNFNSIELITSEHHEKAR
jgi:GNAT superfamily N-acetyltransferase